MFCDILVCSSLHLWTKHTLIAGELGFSWQEFSSCAVTPLDIGKQSLVGRDDKVIHLKEVIRNTWSEPNVDVQCVVIQGHNVECSRTRLMVHLAIHVLRGHDFCTDADSGICPACFIFASSLLVHGHQHRTALLFQESGAGGARDAPSSRFFFLPFYQMPTLDLCRHSTAAGWESQPSSWRKLPSARKSCTWRAQERKLTSFYFLQKWAEIPPLAKNLSLPGLHKPQPAQQNAHQSSIMMLCSVVACHCHSRLQWHSPSLGTLSLLQARLSSWEETKKPWLLLNKVIFLPRRGTFFLMG